MTTTFNNLVNEQPANATTFNTWQGERDTAIHALENQVGGVNAIDNSLKLSETGQPVGVELQDAGTTRWRLQLNESSKSFQILEYTSGGVFSRTPFDLETQTGNNRLKLRVNIDSDNDITARNITAQNLTVTDQITHDAGDYYAHTINGEDTAFLLRGRAARNSSAQFGFGIFGQFGPGTLATPTEPGNGDKLLHIVGQGWNGSAYATGALIWLETTQAWESGKNGAGFVFRATANDATATSEAARLNTTRLDVLGYVKAAGVLVSANPGSGTAGTITLTNTTGTTPTNTSTPALWKEEYVNTVKYWVPLYQ